MQPHLELPIKKQKALHPIRQGRRGRWLCLIWIEPMLTADTTAPNQLEDGIQVRLGKLAANNVYSLELPLQKTHE